MLSKVYTKHLGKFIKFYFTSLNTLTKVLNEYKEVEQI